MINFEQGSIGGVSESENGNSILSFDWLIEPLNDYSQRVGKYIHELKIDLEIPKLAEDETASLKVKVGSANSRNDCLIFD